MRTGHAVAAVLLVLCSVSVSAEPVVVHKSGRIAAAITLRNALPSSVMWGLGLLSLGDMESGRTDVWRADSHSTAPRSGPPSTIVSGIDLVVPCDKGHVLVVYGERAAVDELKSTVAMLDVVPRQVQVKIEVFKLDADEQKELDMEAFALSSISPSQRHARRVLLRPTRAVAVAHRDREYRGQGGAGWEMRD